MTTPFAPEETTTGTDVETAPEMVEVTTYETNFGYELEPSTEPVRYIERESEEETQSASGWIHGVLILCCLSSAGYFGLKGYRSYQPRLIKIADIQVGMRVLSENPTGEEDHQFGEVDPATWKKITLKAPKFDGSFADVVLLRPVKWLKEHEASVGGMVKISVPECGIDGNAKVLAIDACPELDPGEGGVVTGKFRHASATVFDLEIDGEEEPIGTTGNHPFWSEDRKTYVRADELRPGEHLRTLTGTTTVKSISQRGPPQPVYNIEVAVNHTFHVGRSGVLVHNGGGRANPCAANVTRHYPTRPGGTGSAYNELNGQGVYVLREPSTGEIRYIGRGDAPARLEAHTQPGSGKEHLVGEILFENNLPVDKARSLEVEMIHAFGGPKSVNPNSPLLNKIQGIGQGNPDFLRLEFTADDGLLIEALRRAKVLEF